MEEPNQVTRCEPDGRSASESTLQVLASSEALAELGDELLAQLARHMSERRFRPGEPLMRQGDPGDCLLILLEGRATASVRTPDRRTHPVRVFEQADVVGEMALLTGESRTADVVADEQVRALVLQADDFQSLAIRYPELSVVLTELLAARLGTTAHDGLGGMEVGGYRILRCIGRGGMAIVYEAEAIDSGRRVALKMMSHRLVYHPAALSRFRREAEIIRRLRHEGVVLLIDRFSAYRTQFLVLEYCDGPHLGDVIERHGRLDEKAVRPIVGQVARALRYVHGEGILHRDLKPSNVLLNLRGEVKLGDFGLARQELVLEDDRVTRGEALLGTPSYMAPEQLTGGRLDGRTDLYALGCLVYEMLEGRTLYSSDSGLGLLEQRLQLRLPPAESVGSGVGPEMYGFLSGALAPEAADRNVSLETLEAWSGPVSADLVSPG